MFGQYFPANYLLVNLPPTCSRRVSSLEGSLAIRFLMIVVLRTYQAALAVSPDIIDILALESNHQLTSLMQTKLFPPCFLPRCIPDVCSHILLSKFSNSKLFSNRTRLNKCQNGMGFARSNIVALYIFI